MAGALVVTLPVLILYVFAQRYIVESISTTGIKG
jgi:multiple sugar transport system permease protein